MQPFGGPGVTQGHIAESLCREIRAWRIRAGARDLQQAIIAGRLLHEPGTTDP
ncbi:MAG: acyl-CoA/acyl-ACP dehydrogenase [Rubrivivax sp.]|nr:acyl-CoA/acyl-ACP dehydrogenase [Rubrivivax sp.]